MKKKFLKYFIMCVSVIFFMSSVTTASSYDIPVWSSQNRKLNTTNNSSVNNQEFSTDSKQVNANVDRVQTLDSSEAVTNNPLKLTCGGAILIEQNFGKVLYNYNMHEKLRPASVTKVMTILLIMEALDSGRISLTDKVPCSENASGMGGSQIWLNTTEELTVDEMLKAICVVSANDCTVAMAEFLEGSEEAFVEKMNEKAKSLGMNDTTFKNCHGIDEDGHVTSAYDIGDNVFHKCHTPSFTLEQYSLRQTQAEEMYKQRVYDDEEYGDSCAHRDNAPFAEQKHHHKHINGRADKVSDIGDAEYICYCGKKYDKRQLDGGSESNFFTLLFLILQRLR